MYQRNPAQANFAFVDLNQSHTAPRAEYFLDAATSDGG